MVRNHTDVHLLDPTAVASEPDRAPRYRWLRTLLGLAVVAGMGVGARATAGADAPPLAITSDATTTAAPAKTAKPVVTTTSAAPISSTIVGAPRPTTSAVAPTTVAARGNERAFCEVARAYLGRVQLLSISLSDRAKAQNLLDGLPAVTHLAASAPADLRTDVTVLSEAVTEVATRLAGADYDLTRLPPSVVMSLQGPAVTAAMTRLDAWAQRTC